MSEYEALAKTVIKRTLRIKPKENVIVETWSHGLPIATEFVYQLRAVGARPMLMIEDEDTFWRSATTLPKNKLGQVGDHEWGAMARTDAYVFITGPGDIRKIREIGIDKYNAAIGYNEEWYRRAKRYRIRGARIGLGYVSPGRAAAYGFDLDAWRRMVLEASSVDPQTMARAGRKVQTAFSRKAHVELSAPNGTHFECELLGRKASLDVGVLTEDHLDRGENMVNIPAGEAYVCPDERSGDGTIRFDRPVPYIGRWVKGVTFAFDDGRLGKWSAEEGEEFLRPSWEKAKGDKDRIAYLQVGLNPNARAGFLQDAIVAGNVYVGIGDNSESDGKNKTSFFLGSSITDATLTVDGKTIVADGRIVA